MMRQLFCAAAMLVAVAAFSQKNKPLSKDYAYTVSEPYKVVDADDKYYLSENGKMIAVKIDGRDIYIQHFDPDKPALLGVKEYEKAFPKNAVYERILFVNGKVMMFFTQWDGDNKFEQLYVQEIDMDKGEFNGDAKLILKIAGKVSGEGSGRIMDFNLVNKFPVYRSFDKKNFLVKYRRIPEVKRDTKSFDKIGLATFDGDLNKTSERELTMPYTERRMNNIDFQLDNKGNVYLLNKIFEDDSNKSEKKKDGNNAPNYHIELFTLKPGSDAFKITSVDSQNLFVNNLLIYDSPKGDLVMAGFYNKDLAKGGFMSRGEYSGFNYWDNCDGIISYRLKDDGTITDMKTYEIPIELLNQNESKKTQRKNAKKEEEGGSAKFTDLHARGIKINKDGSIVFLAEQYYEKAHTSPGMNGMPSRTYYTYHYNEILIAKVKADGQLAWMRKIPKVQEGAQGQGSMGFNYFRNETDNFLVFFDNPDNVDLPADKTPETYSDRKKGYLTAVRISDSDGTVSRGSILNVKEIEDFKLHQISTNRIVKTTETSFVMEAYKKGKEDVLVKVALK